MEILLREVTESFPLFLFSAHPTFISEVRSILRRIDSLLDALAERRAIPGSSYHLRCEEIFKLHYLGDSVQAAGNCDFC